MNHDDHARLIHDGVSGSGATWADLGSGEGAFTLALADLLGHAGTIHTVDRDRRALDVQLRALREDFPDVTIVEHVGDFAKPIELPPLDGVVMANSLHFERDKLAVLGLVRGYLKPGGRFVLVEYGSDHGNPWVPYPLSFETWEPLAAEAGFRHAPARNGPEPVPRLDLFGAQLRLTRGRLRACVVRSRAEPRPAQ